MEDDVRYFLVIYFRSLSLVEIFELVIAFLNDNIWPLAIVFMVLILRESIASLIGNLKTFGIKSKNVEVNLNTESESRLDEYEPKIKEEPSAKENEIITDDIDEKASEESLFLKIINKFDEEGADMSSVDDLIKEYEKSNITEDERFNNDALFLFLKFKFFGDKYSIYTLENKYKDINIKDEYRYRYLSFYTKYLSVLNKYDDAVGLWDDFRNDIKSSEVIEKSSIEMIECLIKSKQYDKASSKAFDELVSAGNNNHMAAIYRKLSDIEKEKGNKWKSAIYLDKSVECNPDNTTYLFDSAYLAGENKLKELSLVNYTILTKLKPKHSSALNNLGVLTSEMKLPIRSIGLYERSKEQKNTLSMANLGYTYLRVGLTSLAEDCMKEAMSEDSPHENCHKLVADIKEAKEFENKRFETELESALAVQTFLRKFINAEIETFESIKSNMPDTSETTVNQEREQLKISWIEVDGGNDKRHDLNLKCKGCSLEGKYSWRLDPNPSHFYGKEKDEFDVIGYVDVENSNIVLRPKDQTKYESIAESLNLEIS